MNESAHRRVHGFVSGRVQGVYYRYSAQVEAERLGLTGWVRNLPDRRVEFVAEGPTESIRRLLAWAREGPPAARVDELDVRDETPTGERGVFTIR